MKCVDHTKEDAWVETDAPGPLQAGEVRIQVKASAINRADTLQRAGKYNPPPGASQILGLECAGVISEVSEGSDWKVGDEVCALLAGGGMATEVVCPGVQCMPKPKGYSWTDAAAIPEAYITAYLNLFIEGQLKAGERALIHAGGSGVGVSGIQLCKAFGSEVLITASESKLERCLEQGASKAIDRKAGPWVDVVKAAGNVDVILDPVGAGYIQDNISILNNKGRLVIIGLMSGAIASEVPLGPILRKRLRVIGSVLRGRSVAEKKDIIEEFTQRVIPLFEEGKLKPVVHTVIDAANARSAFELMLSNTSFGKIVLNIDA